jgi:hypothetical protein
MAFFMPNSWTRKPDVTAHKVWQKASFSLAKITFLPLVLPCFYRFFLVPFIAWNYGFARFPAG